MADLNEETKTVTRKTWERANSVTVLNTYGDTPKLSFAVEQGRLEDGAFTSVHSRIIEVAFDPSAEFTLINPIDDTLLGGSGTHVQLHVLLYSLFRSVAG
jgi:hypothetical protein